MNDHDLARLARIERDHPDLSWAECIRFARDQADEYAADARLAALGASDE